MKKPEIKKKSLPSSYRRAFLIMKTLLVFIIVSTCLLHAENMEGQNALISLNVKNKKVTEVLKDIEYQSNCFFFYNNESLKLDNKITLEVRNKPVADVLSMIFNGTNIKYTLMDNSIILSPDTKDQNDKVIIKGTVLDTEGEPLIGVSVTVKGEKSGTATNIDGQFTLQASPNSTLQFSYIGYNNQEIKVSSSRVLKVVMQENQTALDEVVVVGYGNLKKSDLTGAVVSVKSADIMKVPTANVGQTLVGKVAGLDGVQAGNDPGSGVNITIRGRRSLTADNSPLFVVDGMPMGNINYVNPEDIQSIEVLKDASSTAIYGSRGANGVVIVTTKNGQKGKSTVSYNGYMGVTKATRTLKMMDGAKYADMKRAAYRTRTGKEQYATAYPDPAEDIRMLSGDSYSIQSLLMAYEWEDKEMTVVKRDANGIPIYHPDRVRSTDWTDLYLRDGFQQKHSISVNAGNEKTRFMSNISYYYDKGIILAKDYSMASLRLNIEHDINKHITFGAQTFTSYEVINAGTNLYGQSPLQMNPLTSPYDETGAIMQYPGDDPLLYNPLYHLDDITKESRVIKTYGTAYGKLKDIFTKGLGFETRFSYDMYVRRNGAFEGALSYSRKNSTAAASNEYVMPTHWVWDNLLTYEKSFNNMHRFNIVAGMSAEESRSESLALGVKDLHYEHAEFYNPAIGEEVTSKGGGYTKWALLSYLGRINYTLKDRYLFTLSGRYDGSSRLAAGHKWSFFPSAAIAWRASEESFIKNLNFFDNLKVRFSYGVNGNAAINPYSTLGNLSRTVYNWGDAEQAYGYSPGSLPAKNLTWEKTTSFNLGLDFGFFDNRINGSIEVYRQNTSDLLMTRTLPSVSGYGSVIDNVGKTRNEGLEISLSTENIRNLNGFSWSSTITFTTYKEKIVALNDGLKENIDKGWFVGESLFSYYTYKLDGIWGDSPEDLAEIAKFNANGSNFAPGKYKVVDQDGNYKINADDRIIIGSNKPAWYGSFENNFSYKNFDLNILMNARVGQRLDTDLYVRQLVSPAGRYNVVDLDYWRPDNQSAKYTAPFYDQAIVDFGNGTASIVKGSFLKVRTITLGYTLPKSFIPGVNIRAYASAYNPFMVTNFDFVDPESASGTGTPSSKKYVFGLNVTF